MLLFVIPDPVVFSQTITVKQDGTGDFMKIQAAVVAANNGDTVLVWPGEYIENVIIENKNITLASLLLTTNDEAYIDSTIINGNQTGSGVAILQGSDTTRLLGFSITNGSGYPVYPEYYCGGGVIVYYSLAKIWNCKVFNNQAHDGGGGFYVMNSMVLVGNCYVHGNFTSYAAGGILCRQESIVNLSGSRICFNHAYAPGGGIAVASGSELVFDSTNRCNIYLNYASLGCDIHNALSDVGKVYVDTFTVINPDSYFVSSINNFGYQQYDIEVDALTSKIVPYDGDLYVNPVSGNDNNTGKHPDSALQTIAFAYTKMQIDSVEKNSIYLAEGIYSDSANGEKFPLNIRPFVHIKGAGRGNTILDGMFRTYIIRGNNEISDYLFSNMSMQRGTMVDYENTFNNTDLFGFIYWENNNIVFDSILFKNGIGKPGDGALQVLGCNNVLVSNCIFEDIKGVETLDFGLGPDDTSYVANCIFNNIKPDYNNPDWINAKALRFISDQIYGSGIAVVQNCLFNNTDVVSLDFVNSEVYSVNNTFVNSSLEVPETPNVILGGSDGYFYNSISFNNGQYPFWISNNDSLLSNFSIYNSLVEGGEDSFTVIPGASLHYDATNIDTNPLFSGVPDYPYNLSSASPCIDAGTLDIPEWVELYPYDLAGNPRIYGQSIDIGAYEWNPTVGLMEPAIISQLQNVLSVAPNPFSNSTSISIDMLIRANTYIDIYNSQGGHIRHFNLLIQSVGTNLQWDGKDKSGRECPAGTYIMILSTENMLLDELKIVKTR